MITVELPPAEPATGREPASCIGQLVWQMTHVVEADEPGVPPDHVPCRGEKRSRHSRRRLLEEEQARLLEPPGAAAVRAGFFASISK